MRIHFFERKFNKDSISIEKLFDTLEVFLSKKVEIKRIKNPYSIRKFYRTYFYFRKNRGDINHIVGDIHWSSLFFDPRNTILTVHDLVGMNYLKGIKKWMFFLFWIYLPFRKLKYIVAISEQTKREILKYMPSVKNKIQVIHNCLTIPLAEETKLIRGDLLEIIIIGTRINKNVERSFMALHSLPVFLHIVGSLSEKQMHILKENKIEYKLYYNVDEAELLTLYDKANVLLFPSLYEGFGLPILEAQARNCVVVTSNLPPMNEVAGDAALLVNPENVAEIRKAIENLCYNDELINSQLKKGRQNLLRYLPETVSEQYYNLYQKIL